MPIPYEVQFEIEGPAAMFSRPGKGSTPISYLMATFPAVSGIFDAVSRQWHVLVQPMNTDEP
jgi:hypothetical protein